MADRADARLLSGRYALGRLLGAGGMADVYEGTDTLLSRTVAVKMLRPDLARDATFLARFRREAQSAASLSHPNVVAVYDTGIDDSGDVPIPYIVMEYVDGPTLRDKLREQGTFSADEAASVVADVSAALDYSHTRGIVHRDIKPGNVMLTSSGMVKVMDFGIARAVTSSTATMTQSSTVLGTAHYLSPEQARGESVDSRSDIYSTGVLLYELLTGGPPFTGESPVAIAYQHVREQPETPSQRHPGVPAVMDAIVMKAMSKNPDNRYQTAGEMRADLLAARAGQTVAAPPVMTDAERTAIVAAATSVVPAAAATSVVGAPVRVSGPGGEEPEGKRRTGIVLTVLGVIGAIALAMVAYGAIFNKGDVEVPSLIGLSVDQAERAIENAGLKVGLTEARQVDDKDQIDQVLDQDPEAGRMVVEDTTVDYTYGTEADVVEVPDVVGQSLEDAKKTLADAELRAGAINRVASDKPEDEVLEMSPAAGSTVAKSSSVALTVASGSVPVPQVVGLSEAEATSTLQDAGFKVTKTRRESPDPEGTVIDQAPSPGTAAGSGSTVNIVVSTGPGGPTQTPTPTPTPTASDTPSPEVQPTPGAKPGPSTSPTPSTTPAALPSTPAAR